MQGVEAVPHPDAKIRLAIGRKLASNCSSSFPSRYHPESMTR